MHTLRPRALPRLAPIARRRPHTVAPALPPVSARRAPSPPPLPDGLKPRPWTGSPQEAAALATVLQRGARLPGGPVDEETAVWVSSMECDEGTRDCAGCVCGAGGRERKGGVENGRLTRTLF